MNRAKTLFIAGVCVAIVIIVLLIVSKLNTSKQQNYIANRNKTADSLLTISLEFTNNGQLDSATTKLVLLGKMFQDEFKSISSYESAMKLLNEIDGLRRDQKEEYFRVYIANMNDEEYGLLLNNKLTKTYYTNPTLNKTLIAILYANRANRNRYILEEKAKQAMLDKKEMAERAKEEREFGKTQSAIRKAYAEKLRENYLDKGMDIKVSVYGKNNSNIKLTFVLFNDVWTYKIQKGTLIEEIQAMGFKKLSLSDGYDYNVHWDF